MPSVLSEKGLLSICVGEGFISSYELGTLAVGDVIRTTQVAGRRLSLRFNGIPMASCELVPIGNLFFAWVTGVEPLSSAVREPGAREEVTELLPFTLSSAAVAVSLQELRGLGPGSLVSLGTPASTSEDVELQVTGIPAARGKIVVVGELLGIRVTRLTGEPFREANVRASGYLVGGVEVLGRVKDYDLSRPDRFTVTTISRIAEIHRYFLRYAGIRLPEIGAALRMKQDQFGGVDQCTYAEWRTETGTGRFHVLVAENAPWRPRGAGEAGETARHPLHVRLVEPESSPVRVSADVRKIIDGIAVRHEGVPPRSLLLVAYRAEGPLGQMLDRQDVRDTLLDCLKAGWKNLVNLNLRWLAPNDPLHGSDSILPDLEMVITATITDAEGQPAMYIVYPDVTLDPLMGVLD